MLQVLETIPVFLGNLARSMLLLDAGEDRSEASAGCTKVRCLPVVKSRRDQLDVSVVHEATDIELERDNCLLHENVTLTRRYQPLSNVLQPENSFKRRAGQLIAAVSGFASVTVNGLEEPLFALTPQPLAVFGNYKAGLRNMRGENVRLNGSQIGEVVLLSRAQTD